MFILNFVNADRLHDKTNNWPLHTYKVHNIVLQKISTKPMKIITEVILQDYCNMYHAILAGNSIVYTAFVCS